ncbi:uncharacterized protein [Nicotiana sylvestris]|uniref:uncharacterized protein n=1 Tax=Nicotiana sylvestris TaxID=4096 RepID=UPI00388CAD7D
MKFIQRLDEEVGEGASQVPPANVDQHEPQNEADSQASGEAPSPPLEGRVDSNADPQDFLDLMQRTLQIIHATDVESVEFTSYRLRDIAVTWYETWKQTRGPNVPPVTWKEFSEAFLQQYLPIELRRARRDRFLHLEQGNMSVREYSMQFNSLARYAPTIVADMSDRVHQFVSGLGAHLINECTTASLNQGMDIARIQSYAQGLEDRKRQQRANREHNRGQQKRVRFIVHHYNFRDNDMIEPLILVQPGHIMRYCPMTGGGGMAQPTASAWASSSSVRPPWQSMQTSTGRGRGRVGTSGSGGQQNRIYDLSCRRDLESSPDVVTGILSIFSIDMYALINPGSTLSYISRFVASKWDREPELLHKSFEVSTLMGESVIVRRVYRSYDIKIHDCHTSANLHEIEMVDFDIIMGMDWLASCYADVDCWTKIVRFNFPSEPIIE